MRIFLLSIGVCILAVISAWINGQVMQFFISGLIYFYFSKFMKNKSDLNRIILYFLIVSPFALSYGIDTIVNKISNGYPIFINVLISGFLGIVFSKSKKNNYLFFTYSTVGAFFLMPNYLSYVHEHNTSIPKDAKYLKLLTIPDSSSIRIDKIKGKVIVLSFWHSRCAECFEEFKCLDALYKKFKSEDGVIIKAVNLPIKGDSSTGIKKIIDKQITSEKYSFPLAFSSEDFEKIASRFEFSAVPTIIVIDKKGNIRYKGFLYTERFIYVNNTILLVNKLLKE